LRLALLGVVLLFHFLFVSQKGAPSASCVGRRVAISFLLPNLVHMDVSTLAGILVPYLDKVFFLNSGSEAVEAAIKFARAAPGIVYSALVVEMIRRRDHSPDIESGDERNGC
jgi:hypothetical protein